MYEVLHACSEQLVRLVAEDRPRGRRDVQAATVGIEPRDEVGRVLREEPKTRFTRAKVVLHALSVGDVADEGAEHPAAVAPGRRDGELDRKLVAVAMLCLDLDAPAEDRPLPGGKESSECGLVAAAIALWNDVLSEAMAHRLLARPAEEGLRPGTPLGDTAGLVQSDDGVERRVDDPTQAGPPRLGPGADRPPGGGPPHVVGDRPQHGEEVVID